MKLTSVIVALCVGAAAAFKPSAALPRMSRALRSSALSMIAVGDKVPDVKVDFDFGMPAPISKLLKGKKTILLGLPGAFTPTWSSTQIPDYLEKQDALKEKGVDQVLVFCVNDGAVMQAWAKDQGIEGSILQFVADPGSELTSALGMELTHPGPVGKLGPKRSKRFGMYIDDGVIKTIEVSENADGAEDPAGDDFPESSCVDNMLAGIE